MKTLHTLGYSAALAPWQQLLPLAAVLYHYTAPPLPLLLLPLPITSSTAVLYCNCSCALKLT
jgi:hypothetical protein